MSSITFINEPVLVEAHFQPGGEMQPLAFRWQGRVLRITDHGRTWQEEAEGARWQCYLVRAPGGTYELRLNTASAQWILVRMWPASALA